MPLPWRSGVELDRGDINPCPGAGDRCLEILCQTAIAIEPREGSLDDPAAWPLDRPALQRLLADIAAGRVDTAVVYKIDRLTRSFANFAKIVEILEPRPLRPVAVWVLRLIERWLKAGILESSGADACWAANAARSVRFDASSSRLSRSWR